MKVILTSKVPDLGNIGEMVNVSVGHARNYLIPRGMAVVADDSNKKKLENQKRQLSKKIAVEKEGSVAVKNKLEGMMLEFIKKVGPNGKLFGSVTQQEISDELAKKGLQVEKRVITITNPIKSVGTFTVRAKLFADVEAKFQVKVVIDPAQLEELKAAQAAAEKRKKDKKAEALAAAEASAAEGEKVTVEQTEEEKLRAEANRILRG